MSMTVILSVDPGSPAQKRGVRPGETLAAVNGHPIVDVLDYKYFTYDPVLTLTLRKDGKERKVKVKKQEGEELGLNFETYLMDKAHSCANHCIFCFVDQLPRGMRESLYFKDDDARLSFLMGNYITLTNLSDREAQRICDLHISPINISVHSTEPELRSMLLGHRQGGRGLELMKQFAQSGITMNCQIVLCPEINDGEHLTRSLKDLAAMYPQVNSVSIIPVGLTCHREGLYPLRLFREEEARQVVEAVEIFGQDCLARLGSRIFWCSDEFYIQAGLPIPPDEFYEDYTQLENGVGMLRLLRTEFDAAFREGEECEAPPFSIACGEAAAPFLREIIDIAQEKCHTKGKVYPIENRFFGKTITVSGLVTGGDLMDQLAGQELGERLLLPVNMLRHGEDVFLDDVTLEQVSRRLGVPVIPVKQDGFDLWDAISRQR